MRQRTLPRGYEEVRLLAALAEEGCPICHDTAAGDASYFFWFFNENYYEAFTLDGLTRSLGFCLAHGANLTRTPVGPQQLAAVHEVLVRRVRAMLSGGPSRRPGDAPGSGLTTCAPCPACQDRKDLVERAAFALARLLEDLVTADRYARSGILCFPHLQVVASMVSAGVFERLLAVHEPAMARAMASLAELRAELGRLPSEERQDLAKALRPSLALAVGHEQGNGAYPSLEDPAVPRLRGDPVGDFLERLGGAEACPVCLEVRRAWIEWVAWLDDAASRDGDVEDLLPACPEHVWPTVHLAGPSLAAATAEKALSGPLGQVRAAIRTLHPPPRREHERPLHRFRDALRGPRRRVSVARAVVIRPPGCPVCGRLALARDRSLSLLFALLEDRQHRAVVESGYGLCLKHFCRALALDPAAAVRAVLVEVQAAKLARLQWELEEFSRKVAWTFRPETKGTEQTAWRRAVLRFSGSLTEAG